MRILITGVAGFIGFHLAQALLKTKKTKDIIYGIDNLNNYYDIKLKQTRLSLLQRFPHFTFKYLDIGNRQALSQLFASQSFEYVINLAAQAGVRYSIENPYAYVDSNLAGFVNLLEGCRHGQVKHLVFASSSSVYGANKKIPFSVTDEVNHPISLYAATKKANELMAYSYSHLYQIPTTGLRFFTVYGPWGRPDMAYFKFVDAIAKNKPINVYNHGQMERDFTYIDDVVEGIIRIIEKIPQVAGDEKSPPYKLYNIGNNQPVNLLRFIELIEKTLGKNAIKNFLPMQPGDVTVTYADINNLIADIGFRPITPIEEGIKNFVEWYRNYYDFD